MRQEEMSFGQRLGVLAGLLGSLSRPWRLFFSRTGPRGPGWREVWHLPGVAFGLGPLALLALGTQSEVLKVALAVAVLSQLEHCWKVTRDGVPSRYAGDSQLTRLFGTQRRARQAEAALAAALGLWIYHSGFPAERPAAGWFVLVGVGHAVTFWLINARQTHADQDVLDAQYEGQVRAGRIAGGLS